MELLSIESTRYMIFIMLISNKKYDDMCYLRHTYIYYMKYDSNLSDELKLTQWFFIDKQLQF